MNNKNANNNNKNQLKNPLFRHFDFYNKRKLINQQSFCKTYKKKTKQKNNFWCTVKNYSSHFTN